MKKNTIFIIFLCFIYGCGSAPMKNEGRSLMKNLYIDKNIQIDTGFGKGVVFRTNPGVANILLASVSLAVGPVAGALGTGVAGKNWAEKGRKKEDVLPLIMQQENVTIEEIVINSLTDKISKADSVNLVEKPGITDATLNIRVIRYGLETVGKFSSNKFAPFINIEIKIIGPDEKVIYKYKAAHKVVRKMLDLKFDGEVLSVERLSDNPAIFVHAISTAVDIHVDDFVKKIIN